MKSLTILFIIVYSTFVLAQLSDRAIKEDILDINSKAQELGISSEQLQGMLNSAVKNGGGDPLPDAMQEEFFSGQASADQFGNSVSSAGDLNGDGYTDLIIGAYLNDAGGSDAGRAYIFFGGLGMDHNIDIILTGEVAGDNFGKSVSTCGDVNGDGYGDVIVGALFNDTGGNNAGRAYIYFGGEIMDNVVDLILTGLSANDWFGFRVSTAGDVNGDGYSDVIVGAYLNDAAATNAGRAYIYFGGTGMNNTADVILTGENANDWFGYSVSTAGDVNGDGYSDVIVGALYNSSGGTYAGRSYIYMGDSAMNTTADVILTGVAGDAFGESVSTAGDINGDGYSDVIVGAPYNDAGKGYIYFGGGSMNNIADLTLTGAAAGDAFGFSVSTAEDINGDGYSDIIIGARNNDTGGSDAGRAYLFFGASEVDNIPDIILTGVSVNEAFSFTVSGAGDINGDGYSDVMIGAPGNSAVGASAGRVYLYTNSLTGTDLPDEFFTEEGINNEFGVSVSTSGDVNGDGYSDVIVGAGGYNSSIGRSYIYFGGPSMDNIADVIMTGEGTNNEFGVSVSTAGDVNGDEYSDVIVGADGYNSYTGRSYIYFGGASMDNTADVIMTGEAPPNLFGYLVSKIGDVNGDGYSDVIVGANGYNSYTGRSYIYFGGAGMDNIADVIMTGEGTSNYFGESVSEAGDVNGDGYSDVIIGAYFYNTGIGRSYIYLGGASMDNTADITMTGEGTNNYFGLSVTTAGDVNGDGYSDVIVGDYDYNTFSGRSKIYFGGLSMNNIADVIMTGEGMNNYFGNSNSTAGDVNGDGYSDVIVGSWGYNSFTGRSYIYFGGSSMDNIADVIMTGEGTNNDFGFSVSTAGDVNGDGYSDVIVGADGYNYNSGRAYLYLSSSPPIQPRIMSVKDVPFDQGGQVFVNFVRSGYDALGESNIITEYLVEMSNPPEPSGFSWIQIGSVQPVQNPLYTFIAETPNDSMTNNSGTYYFRITARTSNPNQYWRSNIMYGHSVDNLAPLLPLNFYANIFSNDVKLGWKANTETDLYNYVIYRTDVAGANPDTLAIYAQTFDTTYIDTNPLSVTAYYFLKAQDIHNNLSPYVSATVSIQTTFSLTVTVSNGWNMVSAPGLNSPDQSINTWWPDRDLGANVFKYFGGYQTVTTTTPGIGYWMKNAGSNTYNTGDEWPAGGIQIVAHDPLTGATGWNLIGGYEIAATASLVTTVPAGQQSGPIYGYSGGYQVATTLNPGYGYWIKLLSNAQIIIPESFAKESKPEEFFPDSWGRIVITDAAGVSYTLYAVNGEVNLDQYELPPAPMEGMYDFRFSSGRIAEDISSSMQTIEMQGVVYPITVRAEGMDMRLMDESGKTVNVNLKSGENVVINDATISKLKVSSELLPTKFSLEQNYPNPFNPSTVIRYQLPESGDVILKVYDILGNEITTLVNEFKIAGSYEVEFNVGTSRDLSLASGIYFYRLEAGSFIETKKMLMLK